MSDHDSDTEPYEEPTSCPEEMRYLEQDKAWDIYAQTSAPSTTSSRKKPPYTARVRRARQQILPLPTTLSATPNVAKLIRYGLTIIITAIVTLSVVAFLLKSQCYCTCTLTI